MIYQLQIALLGDSETQLYRRNAKEVSGIRVTKEHHVTTQSPAWCVREIYLYFRFPTSQFVVVSFVFVIQRYFFLFTFEYIYVY